MKVRLNKFLSQAGVSSRREADRMISEGRVKVNGEVILALGYKIDDAQDHVEVNGSRIERADNQVYLMMNKPPGYLVTLKDPFQRPTIMDLLPSFNTRIYPVGRLDFESQGLLLLTNDGELAHRLMHPRYQIGKLYLVKVKGKPDASSLSKLEKGIYLDGKRTAPAKIKRLSEGPKRVVISIEIYEGRKREIRRMLDAIGLSVLELQRIKFAGLELSNLKPGNWRYLEPKEIARLKMKVKLF